MDTTACPQARARKRAPSPVAKDIQQMEALGRAPEARTYNSVLAQPKSSLCEPSRASLRVSASDLR